MEKKGYEIKGCTVTEDGTCAMHGIEVERRKTDRDEIRRIRVHIGELLTFKNICIGLSFLGSLVITGGYVYTYTTSESLKSRQVVVESQVTGIGKDVADLNVEVAVVKTQYSSLSIQLSNLNGRLEQLIRMIAEERKLERQAKRGGNNG